VTSYEDVTTRSMRGAVPVRISEIHSSNSAVDFTNESNSIFSEGARENAVKLIFSHTDLNNPTDKPVTFYVVLPTFCV
jgi:hypothetical protein